MTLTLAGVTGIIVSVGITADSYIVFFERIKEEFRRGRAFRGAVDTGFKKAFRTILTADTVTLAGSVLLYVLAIGPVKGFALTLGLATVIDVFVAYFFTRPAAMLLVRGPLARGGRLHRRRGDGRRTQTGGGSGMSVLNRLYRGETTYDFVQHRKTLVPDLGCPPHRLDPVAGHLPDQGEHRFHRGHARRDGQRIGATVADYRDALDRRSARAAPASSSPGTTKTGCSSPPGPSTTRVRTNWSRLSQQPPGSPPTR